MSYRELQKQLKLHKKHGLTKIKLNSKKAELEAELARIQVVLEDKNKTFCILIQYRGYTEVFFLDKNRYSIGRKQGADIKIYSRYISRHHATLIRQHDQNGNVYYEIFDGDGKNKFSTNGISLNGHKIKIRHRLKPFDVLVFSYIDHIMAIYHPFQSFNSNELHALVTSQINCPQ